MAVDEVPASERQIAAAELLRRRRARASILAYTNAIDVPGRPIDDADEDAWLFRPIESSLASHHLKILQTLDELVEGRHRNVMIFAPPGSAKSTYCAVVLPTYVMGRVPDSRVMLISYGSDIVRKQGRRARQIARSAKYESIWQCALSGESSAADEWALTNGSEFMAGGILSGITGNRAGVLIVDDPHKNREEAESADIRRKTLEEYQDTLLPRLLPDARQLLIQTRWHFEDLAGSILPEEWDGRSGDVEGRDGQIWHVLNLPAEAGEADVLGRAPGEMIWPEWFPADYWGRYRANSRTWSALYQQRPMPETGDYFKREWIIDEDEMPPRDELKFYGASDYAVTRHGGDYTVHGVVGVDSEGEMWLVDLWRKQSASDEWAVELAELVLRWKPIAWAEETGQIRSGIGPFLDKTLREMKAFVAREAFPTRHDKAVRAQSIRGRMALNGLHVPRRLAHRDDFMRELLQFPAGAHDDCVDMLGLIGQLLDRMSGGRNPDSPRPKTIRRAPAQAGGWMR